MKKSIASKIKVTLLKSTHGQLQMHRDNIRGLGLRRRHHTVELAVTPAVLGMVRESGFMLKVEEV
ncbi:MAG: 50S ribosomal protein L30 [Nevskiaceae bacterium]